MLIPPKYTVTPKIIELLNQIAAHRDVIESITIPPEIEANIRRESTLNSSLYSAKIEGNTLTIDEVTRMPSKDQRKAEVNNIMKAQKWALEKHKKDLSLSEILEIHKICMSGFTNFESLGKIRTNMEAIFNSNGIAIYMPPPPNMVNKLVERLIKFANSNRERFVPIRAALFHYSFEKIHPFLDGNGRVGRILMQRILAQGGYGMRGIPSFEKYLDEHRTSYYRMLEEPEKDTTSYIEFILEAIAESSNIAREQINNKQNPNAEDFLLPRRAEIVRLAREQKMISMDQIRRRFLKVNARTLRYDVKRLTDEGYLMKLGTTRGVYYKLANN